MGECSCSPFRRAGAFRRTSRGPRRAGVQLSESLSSSDSASERCTDFPLFLLYDRFYSATRQCGNRDFLGTLYYTTSGPVIALFALNQRRIIMFAACIAWIILVVGCILPVRPSFIRNVLNVALFQGFVLFIHYMQEMGSRRMYTLRAELKVSSRWSLRRENPRRAVLTVLTPALPPMYRSSSGPSKRRKSMKERRWIRSAG